MKLASYKDGSRDGQLVVVSRDLTTAHFANGIASRLQQVLDDWNFLSPQLEALSQAVNQGRSRHPFPFDPACCMAPLPRATQWTTVMAPPGADAPASAAGSKEPRLRHGHAGQLLGATDAIAVPSEKMGIDFEAHLAVITGDVHIGTPPERAIDAVRLVLLAADVALRHLEAGEPVPLLSRPATSFAPVAVTPDELGPAWKGGRVDLTVQTRWNGKKLALAEAAGAMTHHFGRLVAQAARTRNLQAGALIGTGALACAAPRGHASIADKRRDETADHGEPRTGFMRFGDTLQVDAKGADGVAVFGRIDQAIAAVEDLR